MDLLNTISDEYIGGGKNTGNAETLDSKGLYKMASEPMRRWSRSFQQSREGLTTLAMELKNLGNRIGSSDGVQSMEKQEKEDDEERLLWSPAGPIYKGKESETALRKTKRLS